MNINIGELAEYLLDLVSEQVGERANKQTKGRKIFFNFR